VQAYQVGTALALTSNHGEVLSHLLRDLTGVHASAEKLNRQFSTLGSTTASALAVGAGVGMARMLMVGAAIPLL
jgi:hypothetical protein